MRALANMCMRIALVMAFIAASLAGCMRLDTNGYYSKGGEKPGSGTYRCAGANCD